MSWFFCKIVIPLADLLVLKLRRKNNNKNSFPSIFSIDCQGYDWGGLLKDTFFEFKFLFIQKSSNFDKICCQCPQRTKFSSYVIFMRIIFHFNLQKLSDRAFWGPEACMSTVIKNIWKNSEILYLSLIHIWRCRRRG